MFLPEALFPHRPERRQRHTHPAAVPYEQLPDEDGFPDIEFAGKGSSRFSLLYGCRSILHVFCADDTGRTVMLWIPPPARLYLNVSTPQACTAYSLILPPQAYPEEYTPDWKECVP